ncbi:uncharacterized protein LOC142230989 [Haematobia irritans]|uniref:uncharacterized protein LOC142230989 n=1 Tax=Haematobia irritans TaxID=7368 RepID=UPI003F509186
MIALSKAVKMIHSEGGFEMRNWVSNSKPVLDALNECQNKTKKCFLVPDSQQEKILGVWWIPDCDEFTFFHKLDDSCFDESLIPTKRQLLRIIMKIFDPLGLLGFFCSGSKNNYAKISWDEEICELEKTAWFQWMSKLKNIGEIRVPRRCPSSSQSESNELHIFVDASIRAYAAVAYYRTRVGEEVNCRLVFSKTRVAPLKPISVPRMELMAAVLGLRIAKFLKNEMTIKIQRRIFWTDSKDVLYWINSDTRKFNQFVAVRIGEILQDSNANEWRWVPSKLNVADDGTKISNNNEIHKNIRWFNGPEYLLQTDDHWPIIEIDHCFLHTSEMPAALLSSPKGNNWESSPAAERFSKWEKLRMAQVYVLKFVRRLLKQPFNNKALEELINKCPIKAAELILIKNCQQDEYFEEILQLKSENKMVSRKSTIFKLSPYVDEIGVLRIKGRIDAAPHVKFDTKRPIVLPRKHYLTELITNFYHRRFHHHHPEIVVNEMRQVYYISGMRALVRQTIRNCQKCKNVRAMPIPPEMGGLPQERISSFTRPFSFTGIDYFGPIDVAVGRRHEKRWGVLFTCMTVCAVHIEITSSLSTDSFLLVLKQFISRRGVPRRIFSDNATNFRGASRILVDEIEKICYDEIECKYPDIEWSFITPASPHMGGAWERMIRSVKSILHDIHPQQCIREDILRAALADVENILNMRPLSYVPLDSADGEALTPNHFLLGCSSGVRERDGDSSGTALSRNFRIAGHIADSFWRRWVRECLPCLTKRTKWHECREQQISVGDIVVIVDENTKRNTWIKGRVIDVVRGKDGGVRTAVVKTLSGISTRPVIKLAKLEVNPVTPHKAYGEGNVEP